MGESYLKTVASQLNLVSRGVSNTDIILRSEKTNEHIVFPVVPANLMEINSPQNNNVFNGATGDLLIMGTMGLRTFKLKSFLPDYIGKYSFQRPQGDNAEDIINFIRHYQDKCEPLRITIVSITGSVYLNTLVAVDDFSIYRDNTGDWHYELSLHEYRKILGGRLT